MSATASSLQRKLRKAIEPQADGPEVIEALRVLSDFYGPNTLSARRSLRSSIERRSVEQSRGFLNAFGKLQHELDSIDREVDGLSDACTTIAAQLQRSRTATQTLLTQTARLADEIASTKRRAEAAEGFVGEFTLSVEEEAVLNAPSALALDPLLAALQRVQDIHERAKDLLDGPHQQLVPTDQPQSTHKPTQKPSLPQPSPV